MSKNPLCNKTQIRTNHNRGLDYNTKYLNMLLGQLENEKLNKFQTRYYIIPGDDDEKLKMLVKIIKTIPITRPSFKKLKFCSKCDFTFDEIITNCICLYNLKLKLALLKNKQSKNPKCINKITKKHHTEYIKLLQSFSFKISYDFPLACTLIGKLNPLKSLCKFFIFHYTHTEQYYTYFKYRLNVKEVLKRLEYVEFNVDSEKIPLSHIPSEDDIIKQIAEFKKSSNNMSNKEKLITIMSLAGMDAIENPDGIKFTSKNLTGKTITHLSPQIYPSFTDEDYPIKLTNKAFRRSLGYIISKNGLNRFIYKNDLIPKTSRPYFLQFALLISKNGQTMNEKMKMAKKIEEIIKIPISEMII